jgi:hypothetical protein
VKILRVYVDTSVLGGCFDREFKEWSLGLMDDFRIGIYVPVLSDVTTAEVQEAPLPVRSLHTELLDLTEEVRSVDEEVLGLVDRYLAHGILAARFRNDMLHIALASVAEVDVLVSWNFRHIVRFDKIRLFNAVNAELGYRSLAIHSPREVATHESEE